MTFLLMQFIKVSAPAIPKKTKGHSCSPAPNHAVLIDTSSNIDSWVRDTYANFGRREEGDIEVNSDFDGVFT